VHTEKERETTGEDRAERHRERESTAVRLSREKEGGSEDRHKDTLKESKTG